MYELALFAGAGGGILGGMLCGHTIVGAVEIEEYPREVLKQRQRDGILDKFPIWDDVTTFRHDNHECREYISMLRGIRNELVISGGFPCQDISTAGKGAGIEAGTRSGLWSEMFRIIGEVRPANILIENSPMLTIRGGTRVIADLASMGYDAKWGVIGADAVGANHKRERLWVIANNFSEDVEKQILVESQKPNGEPGRTTGNSPTRIRTPYQKTNQPNMVGGSHDFSTWVDRSKAIGNGQVPAVVRLAWKILG